jgi:hypothetical protein
MVMHPGFTIQNGSGRAEPPIAGEEILVLILIVRGFKTTEPHTNDVRLMIDSA